MRGLSRFDGLDLLPLNSFISRKIVARFTATGPHEQRILREVWSVEKERLLLRLFMHVLPKFGYCELADQVGDWGIILQPNIWRIIF